MSDAESDEKSFVRPIIANNHSDSDCLALSDLSPRDKPWDRHKAESQQIERLYRGTEFQSYSDRIHFCAEFLDFVLRPTDDDVLRLKLFRARFCHVRTCMVCTWRKSLRYKAKAYRALPKFLEDHPKYRFIFLTLTVKNCHIVELRDTLTWMNQSYTRLSRLKVFPGEGWLKSVEVTKGRNYDAHPHFHCLLVVKPSYFGKGYLSQKKWCELWQKSLRVDYQPILDIQALKARESLVSLITEVVKYQTKPSNLIGYGDDKDKEWFLEYTRQISYTKAISIGGILKPYFRELEQEPTDLIGEDETDVSESEARLTFNWRRWERKYRLMD